MSKYAPANESGDKPYIVEWYDWGKYYATVVYSDSAANAKYQVFGRSRPGAGVRSARRATQEQVDIRNARPGASLTPQDFKEET